MSEPGAVWVYAVTEAARPGQLPAGVTGAPVRAIPGSGLHALASDVPLPDFDASALRKNMEDLDWLEVTARAHHDVIEATASAGPAVPMRLATVYRDDGGVLTMLAAHEEAFRASLAQIAGRLEWGVKAFAMPAEAAPAATGAGTIPSGTAYLARRRSQLNNAEDVRRAAAAQADSVHAGLSRLAALADVHQPQDPQLSGDRAPMILNGTYLVEQSDTARFAAAVQQAGQQHPMLRLELTGPWPPYSFALVETGPRP